MKTAILAIISLLTVCAAKGQTIEKMSLAELDSMINVYEKAQNLQKALSYALVYYEKTKKSDAETLAKSSLLLAKLYKYLGQLEEAEPLTLQSLAIVKKEFGELNPRYGEGLSSLASLYYYMGRLEETEALLLQLLQLRKSAFGTNSTPYANTLNNLSELYRSMERYGAAEPLAIEATNILKADSVNSPSTYASALSNLASIYTETNHWQEAEHFYLKALKIWEAHGMNTSDIYVITLNNLALLYRRLNRYEEAIALMNKVIDTDRKVLGEEHPEFASDLHNLAGFYKHIERYEAAEPLYKQALSIWHKKLGAAHPNYIFGLNAISLLYLKWGKYDLAFQYLQEAVWANNIQKDSTHKANITDIADMQFYSTLHISETLDYYYKLCREIHKKEGNTAYLDTAYLSLQSALKFNEQLRNSFIVESDKYRSLSKTTELVKNALETGSLLGSKVKLSELFSYCELNKSMLLADATKAQRARSLGDLPDSLALEELNLQEKSDYLKNLESSDMSGNKAEITKERNELNFKINTFKKQLESNFPRYYKLKYANIAASAEDVKKLLEEKSAFLEYFVTDELIYLFFITRQDLQLFSFELKKEELAQQISNFRKALSDYKFIKEQPTEAYKLYTASAYWFYSHILAPALKDKDISKLIIVADGELGHIPFEAFLVTPAPSESSNYTKLSYLLNNYNISYNYSATLWKENLGLKPNTGNGQILAFAASYGNYSDSIESRSSYLRNLRDILQELPAAKEEVKALSGLFKGTFLYNESASERAFKSISKDYSIIHLAMHGLLNQRTPILSSLAFTEDGDSTEDNFLEAWEISHLNLNANLVVLSACETGYGKFQQGEGVMSLARSFMYAGVPSLVVSMWQVNDASTSLIMQSFYKNLAGGMDKAEALRQAKLTYIKTMHASSPMAAHPAFWAPFVQLGDSRPIKIAQKGGGSGLWWIGGGLVVLVAVGGGVVAMRRKQKNIQDA